MGLFEKMLRGASKGIDFAQRVTDALNESQQAEDKLPPMTPFPKFDEEPIEVPIGDYEYKIYTYDGRPLPHMRDGSIIQLKVTGRNCPRMTGIYRGGVCDGKDALCVGYLDKAIGYMFNGGKLEELAEKHDQMRIAVRFDGMDPEGWPLLTAMLPDARWFNDLDIYDRFGSSVSITDITLRNNAWVGKPVNGFYSIRIEQDEPKSKRKPYHLIFLGDNLCAQINARMKLYKKVEELSKKELLGCFAISREYEESGWLYILKIVSK